MKFILNWFKQTFEGTWGYKLLLKLIYSADNSKLGFSGKKATIIALTYCVVAMHKEWLEFAHRKDDFSLLPIILGSDFGTILALFGINQIDKNKMGKTEPTNEEIKPE